MPESKLDSTFVVELAQHMHWTLGLRCVVGVELEFYLSRLRIYRKSAVEELTARLAELASSGVALSPEVGTGQLELQFQHRADLSDLLQTIMRAKGIVLDFAARTSDGATFAAHPHLSLPGSGLHLNLSLALDDRNEQPGDRAIRRSLAGLLLTMRHGMIFFAPRVDSYFRFRWSCDASAYRFAEPPQRVSWGVNDRSAAIRLVRSGPEAHAQRLEHRVPGADADPAQVLAAVLVGAAYGFESGRSDSEIDGVLNAFAERSGECPRLPLSLEESREAWRTSIPGRDVCTGPCERFWKIAKEFATGASSDRIGL